MQILRSIFVILIISVIFTSCEYFFPSLSGDKITVEEAYNFLKKHKGDEDIVLLDVRTKVQYDKIHIQGAVLMDYERTTFPDEIEKLDRKKTYIIYSQNNKWSANTFELMKELNFPNVHYIAGGIEEWQKQNLPMHF
ncbi:MAG: rhodanese-like domain-containing protein [Chlorobi bacterium]|nr:rhodanese-like domain-containing protein [Chlorobiota bacterium]MCI0716033.1 rhodanese-like domain-containing protein [Chlorobiota bacterium]